MTATAVRRRPAIASGAAALVVAAGIPLVLGGDAVRTGLAVEAVGMAVFAGGHAVVRRGRGVSGRVLAGVGGAVCLAGVTAFAVQADGPSTVIRFLPAMVGVPVLVAAVAPVRGSGSRTLVKLGVGCVFLTVVLAAFFRSAGVTALLGATVASVVAWDAGEHAIGVGEQLGRAATTWRLELVHVAASALVGVAAVAVVHATRTVALGSLSFAGFAVTAVALVLLVVALRP